MTWQQGSQESVFTRLLEASGRLLNLLTYTKIREIQSKLNITDIDPHILIPTTPKKYSKINYIRVHEEGSLHDINH